MMYDISVKNLNGIEVFRGQNFTEELTKIVLEKYATYPTVAVWQSPEQEPKKMEERYQAYEDLAFNTDRNELAKSCAEFLKSFCENVKKCEECVFNDYGGCRLYRECPNSWDLEEGEPNE